MTPEELMSTIDETGVSPLSVFVDFNELLHDFGEATALDYICKLKDLLG